MSGTKQMRHGECGAIMMETLLVLPVYLILLGGLFWVGDVAATKSKLLIFDQGNVWAAGTRHGGTPENILGVSVFRTQIGNSEFKNLSGLAGNREAGTAVWWNEHRTQGTVNVNMPQWISIIASLTNIFSPSPSTVGLSTVSAVSIYAREENDAQLTRTLYSRADTSDWRRSCQFGESLCPSAAGALPVWVNICNEDFPGEATGSGNTVTGVSVTHYLRDGDGNRYADFY